MDISDQINTLIGDVSVSEQLRCIFKIKGRWKNASKYI